MLKRYKIDYDFKANVVVEIDTDVIDDNYLNAINSFWMGAEDRLRYEEDLLQLVLKMLTELILRLDVEHNYNVTGIISLFDHHERHGGIEGWPKMDGSQGIKIISVDSHVFDRDDMQIEEMP